MLRFKTGGGASSQLPLQTAVNDTNDVIDLLPVCSSDERRPRKTPEKGKTSTANPRDVLELGYRPLSLTCRLFSRQKPKQEAAESNGPSSSGGGASGVQGSSTSSSSQPGGGGGVGGTSSADQRSHHREKLERFKRMCMLERRPSSSSSSSSSMHIL